MFRTVIIIWRYIKIIYQGLIKPKKLSLIAVKMHHVVGRMLGSKVILILVIVMLRMERKPRLVLDSETQLDLYLCSYMCMYMYTMYFLSYFTVSHRAIYSIINYK